MTHNPVETVTVELEAELANAVVKAVALELTLEGEKLDRMPVSAVPGDLTRIENRCRRITRLASINGQLRWRAHHPEAQPITSDKRTLMELASVLRDRSDDAVRGGEDEPRRRDAARFAAASRTVARAVGKDAVDRVFSDDLAS